MSKRKRARVNSGFGVMRRFFTPKDWAWIVAGDETQAYMTRLGEYVPTDGDDYLVWEGRKGPPTRIHSEDELKDVLKTYKMEL